MSVDIDNGFWGPAAPSVAALEEELARVRRSRSAYIREQIATVARAAVVNVVVVATREMHAVRAAKTISEVAMRHPSRAIVVLGDGRRQIGANARIELHCLAPSLDRFGQVHYEQVLIRASGKVDDRVGSVIVPLLVPDLPVFLWWTGTPPVGTRHFEELVAIADRLVVDSADFARPEATLPELSRVCVLGATRCALTDLNWSRLTCWRELVTQFFDAPMWRPWLSRIDGIRVGFAVDADGRQIHPSQALLLVAWLGSRLGWSASEPVSPSEAGGHLFEMRRRDGSAVRVRIRPRYELGMDAGDVSSVRVEASGDGHRAEFRLQRAEGKRHVLASVALNGKTVSERKVPLARSDVAELLEEELTIMAGDAVYEEALALLLTLQ